MQLGDTSTAVVKVTCSYKYDHSHELKYYHWFIIAGSVGGLKNNWCNKAITFGILEILNFSSKSIWSRWIFQVPSYLKRGVFIYF